MKYIDAEKLRTEIKRLTYQKKEQLKRFNDEDYSCSVASSINCELNGNEEVLSLITSLQQEQSEVDFEKELDRIWFDNKFGDYFDNSAVDFARIRTLCKHFFEFGIHSKQNP